MVEPLGFLLDVIAKDFHAILVSIEPQQMLHLSVHKGVYIQNLEGTWWLISLT